MSIRKGSTGVGGVGNTRTLYLVKSLALSKQMHTMFGVIFVLKNRSFARVYVMHQGFQASPRNTIGLPSWPLHFISYYIRFLGYIEAFSIIISLSLDIQIGISFNYFEFSTFT